MLTNKYGYSLTICQISEEDGGGWLIEVPELPGCMTDGETLEEAFSSIDDAIQAWINTAKEKGRQIPQPKYKKFDDEYSGKLMIRIPKKLHKDLAMKAEEQDISLNQLISFLLTKGLYSEEKQSIESTFQRYVKAVNYTEREWYDMWYMWYSSLGNKIMLNPIGKRRL